MNLPPEGKTGKIINMRRIVLFFALALLIWSHGLVIKPEAGILAFSEGGSKPFLGFSLEMESPGFPRPYLLFNIRSASGNYTLTAGELGVEVRWQRFFLKAGVMAGVEEGEGLLSPRLSLGLRERLSRRLKLELAVESWVGSRKFTLALIAGLRFPL